MDTESKKTIKTILVEKKIPADKNGSFKRDPSWKTLKNRLTEDKPQTEQQDAEYE